MATSLAERSARARRVLAAAEQKAGLGVRAEHMRERAPVQATPTPIRQPDPVMQREITANAQQLADLFEELIQPGCTVAITGSTSAVFTAMAAGMGAESWAALSGMPDAGLAAASECGIDLNRLVWAPHPHGHEATVLAALIDGFDVVATGPLALGAGDQRRLSARCRSRGTALICAQPWAGAGAQVQVHNTWQGLDAGAGYIQPASYHLEVHRRSARWGFDRVVG